MSDVSGAFVPELPDALQDKVSANLNPTTQPVVGFSSAPAPTPVDTTGLDTNAVLFNLPDARKAFANKYRKILPSLGSIDPAVRRSLVEMDLQRVNKGQFPMTNTETIAAIMAATKKDAITKAPEKKGLFDKITSLPGSVVKDATGIVKSVPHMPGAIVNEAFELPKITQRIDENREKGMGAVEAIAQAPGVRLLPGAYTVGNVTSGKGGEILDHPLMTLLDVLPAAGKAAGATRAGKVAAAEGSNVLRAALTKKVLPAGELGLTGSALEANRLGKVTATGARTRLGQWMTDAFSPDARELAGISGRADQQFAEILKADTPVTGIDQTARDAYSLLVQNRAGELGITPDDMVKITDILETDRRAIADLPDAQQEFARQAIELQQRFEDHAVQSNNVMRLGGEIYDVKSGGNIQRVANRLTKLSTQAQREMLPWLDDIVAMDEGLGVERAAGLREAIAGAIDGNMTWQNAAEQMQSIMRGRTNMDATAGTGQISGPSANVRLDSLFNMSKEVRKMAATEKMLGRLESRAPARWHPVIQKEAKGLAEQELIQRGVDPMEASRVVAERDFAAYPDLYNQDALNKIIADLEPMWRELKAEGVDPMFVHRVPLSRESLLELPRVSDFVMDESAYKGRELFGNTTPYRQDITVSLSHQGAEILSRRLSESYTDTVMSTWGKPEAELYQHYLAEAREAAAKDPTLNVEAHVAKLMKDDYTPFDPKSFTGGSTRTVSNASDNVWIPKTIQRNLDRMHTPNPSALLATLAPITGAFRTAVLPLSPRWHINNFVGNMIRLMGEEGPAALFNWSEARRLVGEAKKGSIELPPEARYALNVARRELAADVVSMQNGGRFAEVWKKIQDTKAAQVAGGAIQKSYDVNSFFDDTTKIMGYLQGQKRGIRKGGTAAAGQVEAVRSMRKVGQMWDEMTPIERQVIRQVFPFYSFTGNIMRYVGKYPIDHPIRASITASFARAEIEDMGEGLPLNWLDTMGIGDVDENGNQTRVSIGAMNPFGDVADMATLKGFIAGINPIGGTVLEQLGADTGGGSAFGPKSFNPATGKLDEYRPGLVGSLIGNTIPQVGTLTKVLGLDSSFAKLRRDNPEAAERMLLSGIGVPTSVRSVNVPQQYMKGELNRIEAQRQALKSALESGDYSGAEAWPALRPYIEQIKVLRDQGALAPYNPTSGAPGGMAGFVQAVTPGRPWPT